MFDIIKDLKENIKKNNMKKLVLSAVLGMFCYCTNNAMEDPQPEKPEPEKNKEIKEVLTVMLESQVGINKAREKIKDYEKKIYNKISEVGKVTKKKVLGFIKNQFTEEEQTGKEFQDDINKIEQYFHLEEQKDDYECTKENLTEIFWEKVETISKEDKKEIDTDGVKKINEYFQTIIDAEKAISKNFEEYYNTIKANNQDKGYEDILKTIMNDCCGEEEGDDIQTKFLDNLGKLCKEKSIDDNDSKITGKIKRRITLSNGTGEYEKDFIYFLKQKIGEEKKEPVPPVKIPSVHTKKEECPCCCQENCLKKKENLEGDLGEKSEE